MTLTDRDKKMLVILGAFFAVVAVYLLADWAMGGGTVGSSVSTKEQELRDIIQVYRTFQKTQADFQTAEREIQKAGDFELLTELENLAVKANVKDHIESMDKKSQAKNPYYDEEAVEVKLQKINIIQLITFLYEIEYATKVLRVREMHLETRFDSKDLFNARVMVSTYRKMKGAPNTKPAAGATVPGKPSAPADEE